MYVTNLAPPASGSDNPSRAYGNKTPVDDSQHGLCMTRYGPCNQSDTPPASGVTTLRPGRDPFASGPHALVFAHFVPYFFDIPCTYHFTVCG
jgi:hypothetical protein